MEIKYSENSAVISVGKCKREFPEDSRGSQGSPLLTRAVWNVLIASFLVILIITLTLLSCFVYKMQQDLLDMRATVEGHNLLKQQHQELKESFDKLTFLVEQLHNDKQITLPEADKSPLFRIQRARGSKGEEGESVDDVHKREKRSNEKKRRRRKGQKGEPGEKGDRGPQGPAGIPSFHGPYGAATQGHTDWPMIHLVGDDKIQEMKESQENLFKWDTENPEIKTGGMEIDSSKETIIVPKDGYYYIYCQLQYNDRWNRHILYYMKVEEKIRAKVQSSYPNLNSTHNEDTSITKYTGRLIKLAKGDSITVAETHNEDGATKFRMDPETSFFGATLIREAV